MLDPNRRFRDELLACACLAAGWATGYFSPVCVTLIADAAGFWSLAWGPGLHFRLALTAVLLAIASGPSLCAAAIVRALLDERHLRSGWRWPPWVTSFAAAWGVGFASVFALALIVYFR